MSFRTKFENKVVAVMSLQFERSKFSFAFAVDFIHFRLFLLKSRTVEPTRLPPGPLCDSTHTEVTADRDLKLGLEQFRPLFQQEHLASRASKFLVDGTIIVGRFGDLVVGFLD